MSEPDIDEIIGDLPQYTDTLAALHAILQSRQVIDSVPNLILRHQLYAIIQDKTEVVVLLELRSVLIFSSQVDDSIAQMRSERIIRTFSIPFQPKDLLIMLEEDYRRDIDAAFSDKEVNTKKILLAVLSEYEGMSIYERDILGIVSQSIPKDDVSEMALSGVGSKRSRSSFESESYNGNESTPSDQNAKRYLDALCRSSTMFLLPRRDVAASDVFYFTHPEAS
jgi:hypothetical protein